MSIAGDIAHQRNTISYDQILDDVRSKNGSNASIDDLSMFHANSAEDPLEALIKMEDADEWPSEQTVDLSLYSTKSIERLTTKYQPLNTVRINMETQTANGNATTKTGIEANGALNGSAPSVVVTEQLHEMLDEMTQFTFRRLVTGGYWVASLLHESSDGRPDDFTPDVHDVKAGIAQAVDGIEMYAYNRDVQDTDPARKGMTTGQWNFLSNMAKQATDSFSRLDTLKGAGFAVNTTFENEYAEVRDEIAEKARIKQQQANQREARRKDALSGANMKVRAKLDSVLS